MASACVELGEEAINVLLPKSPVTATGNTVCPYYPAVTPPSQRIAMDMEKPGYLSHCQHRPQVINYHIFPHLPFNQTTLMIIHSSYLNNHPKLLIRLVNSHGKEVLGWEEKLGGKVKMNKKSWEEK